MHSSVRLLARYLQPGAPTGLAGLVTHASPRSTLLFLYATTLEKLQAVPEQSVYRQSVEAVTRHRLAVVEAVKPAGYEAWQERARALVAAHPEQFAAASTTAGQGTTSIDGRALWRVARGGQTFVIQDVPTPVDPRKLEWDGELFEGGELEGIRTAEERTSQVVSATRTPLEEAKTAALEAELHEPQLTAEQIEEIEAKIGAGLIEEVIEVAEGEAKLVDVMIKAKVWESLEEKPADGQWAYFERK